MMPQTIAIPSPSRADTETVSTALETAAVFRSNGDSREAMRWLRRAAESAGAAGDDERALSLSRIVADLHEELDALEAQEATPYPPPPSARAARPPSSSPRTSHPPAPSTRSARPPSVRPPSLLPRPSQAPRPSARPSYAGAARLPSSVAPARLAVVPPLPSEPDPASAPPAAPGEHEPVSASPPLRPEPASVPAPPAASMSAPPAASMSAPPPEPARVSSPSSPPTTGARHAARVQVAISTTKVGILEVRLLAEGENARLGSSEAFLIMLDPASTLLAR
jgi:hypothetical protein